MKEGDFVLLKPYQDVEEHLGINERDWTAVWNKHAIMRVLRANKYAPVPAFYTDISLYYWPASALILVDQDALMQYDMEKSPH